MTLSEVGLFHSRGADQTFEADEDLPPRTSMTNVTVVLALTRSGQQGHDSVHQPPDICRLQEKLMITQAEQSALSWFETWHWSHFPRNGSSKDIGFKT